MLQGALHRWESINFGTLDGMNDAGLDVSVQLRPTPNGIALALTLAGRPGFLQGRLGGDIAIRLHTHEGIEDAVPLRPRIHAVCGNGLGAAGTVEVLFPWRTQPFAAGIFELSTPHQTCLLAVPHAFLNDPRQRLDTPPPYDPRKAPASIPSSPGVRHLLPQWVRYPTTPLPNEASLDLAQRNPFEGITELRLLQPAFDTLADDMMHSPRTSIVIYVDGQAVRRARCVAILRSQQSQSLCRVDRHLLCTRAAGLSVPCWGELAVEIDGAEVHREPMPSSLFAHGQGLPGDRWLTSPHPYHETDY